MNVLITGGAGFIGLHLTRRLLREGCDVTILDNFSPQVHGDCRALPPDVRDYVRLIVGDVRDRTTLQDALRGQDAVVHFAAETGTGQSMYEPMRYEAVNMGGTATLVDCLINDASLRVAKVVAASSRAVYGEGKYQCVEHGVVFPEGRTAAALAAGRFEPQCPVCGQPCSPLPTDEAAPFAPLSFYGLTKQVQEQMTLMFARARGLSAYALRYQNVYGPGQSLSNPYTGILAIFSNLARLNQPIHVFEDGRESRDFVYVDDVVDATWRCLRSETTGVEALNVGSGVSTSVSAVVSAVCRFFASESEVRVTGEYRLGDIRHNFADLARVGDLLGWAPATTFEDGIGHFLRWAGEQQATAAAYETSLNEMKTRRLMGERQLGEGQLGGRAS